MLCINKRCPDFTTVSISSNSRQQAKQRWHVVLLVKPTSPISFATDAEELELVRAILQQRQDCPWSQTRNVQLKYCNTDIMTPTGVKKSMEEIHNPFKILTLLIGSCNSKLGFYVLFSSEGPIGTGHHQCH